MQSKLILFALFSFVCLAFADTAPVFTTTFYNLTDARYQGLFTRMNQVTYSDQRASMLRDATKTYGFNCTQIAGFLASFKSDGDKLFALNMVKANIVDPINKQKIIDSFNRTDDRETVADVLNRTIACKTVANPSDATPAFDMPYSNIWTDQNLTDLIKVINQIPISVGKLKVAEVSIMSQTEVLTPEHLMTLFGAFASYRDILTLKEAIRERIVGITCDQMITLLQRFSFDTQRSTMYDSLNCSMNNTSCNYRSDLLALSEFIQGSLSGESCQKLSPLAQNFSFEDQKLAILEGFTDAIVDVENKYTILDAFFFGNNKEKARKIIDTFKANSYLFGSPAGKTIFIIDVSGSMSASFKVNGQSFTRLSFVKNEFNRVLSSFNSSMSFNVLAFAERVVSWSTTLQNATQANIKSAVEFSNRQNADGGTNSYDALKTAFNTPGVESIYFLSDGTPSSGPKTAFNDILADVRIWNAKGHVKINSIAMLMGTYGTNEAKGPAREFMKMLSDITGGTHRALEVN